MIKSNKILCIVSAILIAFVGLFGIIFATQNDRVVKADSVSTSFTYYGSTLWLPFTTYELSGVSTYTPLRASYDNSYFIDFANFEFTLEKRSYLNDIAVTLSGGSNFANSSGAYSESLTAITANQEFTILQNNFTAYLKFNVKGNFHGTYYNHNNTNNISSFYIQLYFSSNDLTAFSCNVYKVREYSDWDSSSYLAGNHVRYYDTNENYLDISITHYFKPVSGYSGVSYDPFGQTDRLYFLSDISNLTDNQYYQTGYDNGFNVGNSAGYDSGYSAGYDVGNSAGYNSGYSSGVQDANDYTFLGLIGATIDAPISAFFGRLDTNPESPTYNQIVGGFFNFELFGVNLRSFFFAILTFALVIVIIRFALGK